MSIRNYNAWIKAARKAAKRTAGLAAPSKRKALERAQARVAKAQAAVGKANVRLGKAKLAEARASMRMADRDLKAVERAGNVTMAEARKAYAKMRARLGRALKGTDVKAHPRMVREAFGKRKPKPGAKKVRRKVPEKPKQGPGGGIDLMKIRTIEEFERLVFAGGEIEYVSTAKYPKKGKS